jgi:NAD(P)H-dependent FMN reductase
VSPSATPRHNRIARLLANALEDAAPTPWQVTTDVDLRISDVPLHNRRPDVLVFSGNPDELPVRPQQVKKTYIALGRYTGALKSEDP